MSVKKVRAVHKWSLFSGLHEGPCQRRICDKDHLILSLGSIKGPPCHFDAGPDFGVSWGGSNCFGVTTRWLNL